MSRYLVAVVLFGTFIVTGCSDLPPPVSTASSIALDKPEPQVVLTPDQIVLPPRPKPEEEIELIVNADGDLVVTSGQPIKDLEQIKMYVAGEAMKIRNRNVGDRVAVRIQADNKLSFERVQKIMDQCRACGIDQIQLRAMPK